MGAKPKALGAKIEAIQVACQKHWVLKLVLSKQCTWRRCCDNLETQLVRKLQTFSHLPRHCSLWQWSLYDVATAWSLSMARSPIPLVLVPLVWCLVMASLLMVAWWRPWPTKLWANFHEGSNPWSATSDSSGSVMGSVAPYP